jgi:hypothetical protein
MERERERKREIYRERDRERVREKERERERERESERERERETRYHLPSSTRNGYENSHPIYRGAKLASLPARTCLFAFLPTTRTQNYWVRRIRDVGKKGAGCSGREVDRVTLHFYRTCVRVAGCNQVGHANKRTTSQIPIGLWRKQHNKTNMRRGAVLNMVHAVYAPIQHIVSLSTNLSMICPPLH